MLIGTHWWEIGFRVQERVDGLDDGADIGLRAGSADAHPAGLLGQLFGQMNGDHQDGNFRKKLGNLPGNVKSIQIRHLEIQQNHVRRIFLHPLKRFSSGASLVADLPSALLLEQTPADNAGPPGCRLPQEFEPSGTSF